jgi:hypothetical protein
MADIRKMSGLQNRSGTRMCRRDEHASACRDKGGAERPRLFVCKPRQDARFCKLIKYRVAEYKLGMTGQCLNAVQFLRPTPSDQAEERWIGLMAG